MQYIKEITVDLSGEMYFSFITAVQGDENSRYIKITLVSNGIVFNPPTGAAAVLRCKKPDGTFVFNDATINEDGTITAELTENMIAAAGNCKCEVSIYGADESTLTSVPFIVKVTQAAVNPDITSTDEYTALTSALNRIDDAKQIANTALKESTEALNNIEEIESAVEKASSDSAMRTVEAHNAASGTHEDIRSMANEAKTIALGKANSLVFDTKEQLDSWVGINENLYYTETISDTFNYSDYEIFGGNVPAVGGTSVVLPKGTYTIGVSDNHLSLMTLSEYLVAGTTSTYQITVDEATATFAWTGTIPKNETVTWTATIQIDNGTTIGYPMNAYTREDGKTTDDLKIGDNLYIVELGVPDYWWDGNTIQPLGAEKPNLADYYTVEQINKKIGSCIFGQMSEVEYDAATEAGTLDAGRIYFVY